MKVQKALIANTHQIRWLVIDASHMPVKPIQQYLNFLEDCNKSPLTLRTYAYHLKLFWTYLVANEVQWDKVNIDTISEFIASLKGQVSSDKTESKIASRSTRTINQIIIAVSSFYVYHERRGNVEKLSLYFFKHLPYAEEGHKSLLHHITKRNPIKNSVLKLKERKSLPKTVDSKIVQKILDCCTSKRDRLLIALLHETGCRVGQALGLRHEDIESYSNLIHIVPRDDNANYARAKSLDANVIHVTKELMSLYINYFIHEYGDIDSPYVFINLWGGALGKPITYPTVIALFKKISRKIGQKITPHMLRHTHATELLKAGWDMAYIQKRLGHKNIQTTTNIYTHLTASDIKEYYQSYIERRKKHES